MKIGMTLPVMEPNLTRKDLENWTIRNDEGPWSHIALGERILFHNPEFISTLRTYSIGETVSIGLLREIDGIKEQIYIKTTLIEHVEYEGEPMVGFLATTVNERFDFPFEIDIKTGNVGGPSAGLMMALNVYNNLIPEDITNSKIIAGTGTIEIDGSVGPVGGVKQKIIAAKRAGAELILVPVANFEEAQPFETDKTAIVAVDSFDEALAVISQYSSR